MILSINKYKQYLSCKPSNIEWIGEIPTGWDVKRFRFIFSFNNGLNITKENLQDSGVPCVNYGEIHSKYGFEVIPGTHHLKCVDEKYLASSKKSLLNQGDFIFADTSEDIEGSGNFTYINSNIPAFAGYHTIIARPIKTINSRYLSYLFDSISFRTQIRSEVVGIKVYSITKRIIKNALVLLPPLPEQQAIATFLDRETARINRIIEKQTRLIELLKEKRSALITQAVTRGLDPNAKMKDSGVEWIGEIPEGWEVKRLKLISQIIDGDRGKEYPSDNDIVYDGIPFLSTAAIIDHRLDTNYFKYISQDKFNKLGRGKLTDGDLIVTVRGTIGNTALFLKSISETGFINAQMMIIRHGLQCNFKLLFYISLSNIWSEQLNYYSYGSAQQQLSYKIISAIQVPIPPINIQNDIIIHIETELNRIDNLLLKIENQIDLLNEYKQSLITAAVTGKIDVRDVQ